MTTLITFNNVFFYILNKKRMAGFPFIMNYYLTLFIILIIILNSVHQFLTRSAFSLSAFKKEIKINNVYRCKRNSTANMLQ